MYLFVEVIFYSGQWKHLPVKGYRLDAVFNKSRDYWGITFIELPVEKFDVPTPAIMKFSFQDCHYQEVMPNQLFEIMEIKYLEWNLNARGNKNYIIPSFVPGYMIQKNVDIMVLLEFRCGENWNVFKCILEKDYDLYLSPYISGNYNQVCIALRRSRKFQMEKKPKLSVKVKTITMGENYKLKLKKVYKKKTYKCKITVKDKKPIVENPMLNSTDVTLYHLSNPDEKEFPYDKNHLREYRFRVSGTKKEVSKWEVVGEDADYFTIATYGLVKTQWGPAYVDPCVTATVVATFSVLKTDKSEFMVR